MGNITECKNADLRKLLNSAKILPHYIKRENESYENLAPVSVEFHWCSTCNYNCIHCSYAQRRKSNKCLTQEVTAKTIDDLIKLGTKAIYFSGGGEPTTFKNWGSYAKKVVDSGIEAALITNSIMLKESDYEMLREFNYIAVSVYSTDEGQYKKITGSNCFEKQFLLPKLLKADGSDLIVGARCVIDSINYKNIFKIYEKAIKEGFDYIIFIPAVDYEKNQIDLTEEQKHCVLEQIENGLEKINPANTNLLNIKKNGIRHYKKTYLDDIKNCTGCDSIKIRTNAFINYDGNVYLCQPLIGCDEYSIGNLNEQDFANIWNSKKHFQVIEKLNERFSKGDCENCRAIGYNIKINDYLNKKEIENIPQDNFL